MMPNYEQSVSEDAKDISFSRVVRSIGHDLRNNLCVMANSVYYINMRIGQSDERLAKHLDILKREIAASNRVLVNMVDLAAPKEPVVEPCSLNVLVQEAVNGHIVPEGVDLDLGLISGLPDVRVDPRQISHALGNILGYQYGTLVQGGTVQLSTFRQGMTVCARFADSGPGLGEEALQVLFDLEEAGGGFSALRLGLTVARHLTQLNQGRLEVVGGVSAAPQFVVCLPACTGS